MLYALKSDRSQVFEQVSESIGQVALKHSMTGSFIRVTYGDLDKYFNKLEQKVSNSANTTTKKLFVNDDAYYAALLKSEIKVECEHLFSHFDDKDVSLEICLHCHKAYGLINGAIVTLENASEYAIKLAKRVADLKKPINTIEHFLPKTDIEEDKPHENVISIFRQK